MNQTLVTILVAFLGASGIFSFIMFLIQRHDKKKSDNDTEKEEFRNDIKSIKDTLEELKDQAYKSERDNVRTQLLVLMADYPDNISELMECAEHYFKDMDGDWYLTPIFAKFLESREVARPEWLLKIK